jgi:endonuclease YncB( thermonuclease family)
MPEPIDAIDELINKINMEFYQLRLIRNDIQTNSNYHFNTIPLYEATLTRLDSVRALYAQLIGLVAGYESELSESNLTYAKNQITALGQMITGFALASTVPQISVEEAERMIFSGVVDEVEDGDTLIVAGRKVRLVGIDCPEIGTERGKAAQAVLSELVLGKSVDVFIDPHNPIGTYARILGVVRAPDGTILNRELIRRCLAAPDFKGKHRFIDQDLWKKDGEVCKEATPGFGLLSIYSNPTQSAVWIDGEDIHRTTPTKVEVPLGVHEIMVVAPDHSPQTRIIDVQPGLREEKFFLKPVNSQLGFVQVVTRPLGANISVDGELKGVSPLLLSLPADVDSVISIELDGYMPQYLTVTPILGITYTVEEALVEE